MSQSLVISSEIVTAQRRAHFARAWPFIVPADVPLVVQEAQAASVPQ